MVNNVNAEKKNNQKKIFGIESDINSNKKLILESRLLIEENRAMILNNYSAAYAGNTNLAITNTNEIYENRKSIISKIKVEGELQEEFVDVEIDKAKLDFMKHQSNVNSANLEISNEMAEINSKLIEINTKIMENNQSIYEFNKLQIKRNKELLEKKIDESKITYESNELIRKQNKETMHMLENNEKNNKDAMYKLVEKSKNNSHVLAENRLEIHKRRDSIMSNNNTIQINRSKIFFSS